MKINIIKFKNYSCDYNDFKTKILHLIELVNFANYNSLTYKVSGSLSFILLSGKLYRKVNDIDMLINKEEAQKWIAFLEKDWKTLISENESLLKFRNRKTNTILDLMFIESFLDKNNNPIEINFMNGLIAKISNPSVTMAVKKEKYGRETDFDDFDFYKKIFDTYPIEFYEK